MFIFLDFFFVEGYLRKEREKGLFRFPIVISRLIHEMTRYDVVYIIELKQFYDARFIKLNLKNINFMVKEEDKLD